METAIINNVLMFLKAPSIGPSKATNECEVLCPSGAIFFCSVAFCIDDGYIDDARIEDAAHFPDRKTDRQGDSKNLDFLFCVD